ncbi:MAG: NAD-dependent epimerase/dehydratase family protein [Desulfamplus sp.]|nr:NAD-dependent epimerase/dehydratase family protein [Desulfamplus sp.]
MKKNKILVTGGGGFLGKAIIKMLVERGDHVSSFSRHFYPELANMGVKQFQGDIADPYEVEKACTDIDMVFHVAAKAGVSGRWADYFKPNVIGTENIVKACLKHGVRYLIHTSSPSVVFDGNDMEGVDESAPYPARYHAPYPATKAIAERIVVNAASDQLKTVILRPHLIWGPEDNHLLPGIIARHKRLKRVGDGKNLVDTIYIDNAAHAHILAGDKLKEEDKIKFRHSISGKVYFISQDAPVLLWKMVDDMLNAADLPPIKGSVSLKTAEMAGVVIDTIFNLLKIEKEPPMTQFMAKELATSHWFDISRAKKDLGYYPIVSTQEGLIRLKNWLLSKNCKFFKKGCYR